MPLLAGPEETPLLSDTSPGVPERCGSHSYRPRSTPCPGSLSSHHFPSKTAQADGKTHLPACKLSQTAEIENLALLFRWALTERQAQLFPAPPPPPTPAPFLALE